MARHRRSLAKVKVQIKHRMKKTCLTNFVYSKKFLLRLKISSCLGSTRPDVSGPGEEVPITITMTEPKIQIIEVGNTVRFSCNAIPRFRSQVSISKFFLNLL